MENERYVDPNSGAAPQPGGYAGIQGGEKGFALPVPETLAAPQLLGQPEEEPVPSEYEAPGGAGGDTYPGLEGDGTEAAQPAQVGSEDAQPGASEDDEIKDEKTEGTEVSEEPTPETQEADDKQEGEGDDAKQEGDDTKQEEGETKVELPAYNPAEYSVKDVQEYIAAHPDEEEAILASEKAGQARKGLVGS